MDAELKAKWIEALRNGKYRQARRCLRDSFIGGYCCLGVLADVQGAEWDGQFVEKPLIDGRDARYNGEGYLAPFAAGGISYKEQMVLASLNDDGKPFSEIADYIEKNL